MKSMRDLSNLRAIVDRHPTAIKKINGLIDRGISNRELHYSRLKRKHFVHRTPFHTVLSVSQDVRDLKPSQNFPQLAAFAATDVPGSHHVTISKQEFRPRPLPMDESGPCLQIPMTI